jgi:hypothetical protein
MKYYVVNKNTGSYGVYSTLKEAQLNVDGAEWVLLAEGEKIEDKA